MAIFGPATSTTTEDPAVAPDDVRRLLARRMPKATTWVGHSREGFIALLPGEPDPRSLQAVADDLHGDDRRVGLGATHGTSPTPGAQHARRSARSE